VAKIVCRALRAVSSQLQSPHMDVHLEHFLTAFKTGQARTVSNTAFSMKDSRL
jgi:hypothetical protein